MSLPVGFQLVSIFPVLENWIAVLAIPDGPTGDPVNPVTERGSVGNSLFIKFPLWFQPVTPVVVAWTTIGVLILSNPTCHFVWAAPSLYVASSRVLVSACKSDIDVFHCADAGVYITEEHDGVDVETVCYGKS